MKTLTLKNCWTSSLSGLLLAVSAAGLFITASTTTAQKQTAINGNGFFIRNYAGKCLDFGAPPHVTGAPVFIFGCNGTIAQQVYIQEVNEQHDVILRAGNKVLGVNLDPVVDPNASERTSGATALEVEIPLELQDEKDLNTVFSRGQIFALDGDSIMLAANHKLVVKVKNARGADRTPLVLGQRNLADAEFWDFNATDGSGRRPTSGFVSVTVPDANKFVNDIHAAKPGAVFEIHPDLVLDLTNQYVVIPAGVTLRGDRRGTRMGPEIFTTFAPENVMFEIGGRDVRITGLRLRGPSRSKDEDVNEAYGIRFDKERLLVHGVIVDHNDMSAWPLAAVDVRGGDSATFCQAGDDNPGSSDENVRVVRNFIHHNQKQGEGYGVHTANGGNTLIEGNTFVSNRHAIAAGGEARTIYRAWYNLVLTAAPKQSRLGIFRWHTHDFDMHGTDNNWWYPSGFGGIGGQYVQIERNTFLGRNRNNFKLRGEPCYRAEFLHNVSLLPRWEAVECTLCGDEDKLVSNNSLNWYDSEDPTDKLGVGDFDGDGTNDLFLATGAAWYYSPQGTAAWRFLNTYTEGIDSLRFGDFDGDGRTDVLTQHRGRDLVVSWGGASKWEKINEANSSTPFKEFRTGDFIGDRRADIFYADGQQWFLSDGGAAPFTPAATSGYQTEHLGFGDFNADGKTDVLGLDGGMWKVSLNALGAWADFPLRSALTTSIGELHIADLNANGIADVLTSNGRKVSYDGRGNWVKLPSHSGTFSTVGQFDGNAGADILFFWDDRDYLGIKSSGVGSSQRHSSQDMR